MDAWCGAPHLSHTLVLEAQKRAADFLLPAYQLIKQAVAAAPILHADETPHFMLERSESKYWYTWGFSSTTHAYFEIHNTRSGEVAARFFADAQCEYVMTDVFSGYKKALREANTLRCQVNRPAITGLFCNAHALRKFKDCAPHDALAADIYELYQKIFQLQEGLKNLANPLDCSLQREKQMALFQKIHQRCKDGLEGTSEKSALGKAIHYFLGNYEGFTQFLSDLSLPIDNNAQERLFRQLVVGRKTWIGTHSERGAETTAVLFTIFQTCRMNGVNPRDYLWEYTKAIHKGDPPFTPYDFKKSIEIKKAA